MKNAKEILETKFLIQFLKKFIKAVIKSQKFSGISQN